MHKTLKSIITNIKKVQNFEAISKKFNVNGIRTSVKMKIESVRQ
jgi:hypothetical protein